MKILIANAGSTSLKFQLFEMPEETVYCRARIERVGSDDAIFHYMNLLTGYREDAEGLSIRTYADGIRRFLSVMLSPDHGVLREVGEIRAVGFKTVLAKGFYGVHLLTEEVLQGMRDYLYVAPAHNGPYLEAIGQFREILPDTPMVGAFETAFHTTIPPERTVYSGPYEWVEKYGIRRFGYHGASHSYIAEQAPAYGPSDRLISCHLGGSCSVCAIDHGKSVDTSFGFSLQTGVLHANRIGDIDPYIVPFLMHEGEPLDKIMNDLSKNSGLLGISGVSNDLRKVMDAADGGNERAALAVKMFTTGIIRYIGMFYAELGGLDQLVFTGGIGENSAVIRETVCAALSHFGIRLDDEKNRTCREGVISADDSPVQVLVIPANEELGVARKTFAAVQKERTFS